VATWTRTLMMAAATSAAACATTRSAAPGAADRSAAAPPVTTAVALRGSFSTVLQSTGGVGPAKTIRVDGSVTVASAGVGNSKTRVHLTASFPVQNEQLPWAIAPGACGNGAIAVAAVSKFGTIDVGATGRGSIDIDLAIVLTPGEQYHVEIYRSGQTLSDVMACATLRRVE